MRSSRYWTILTVTTITLAWTAGCDRPRSTPHGRNAQGVDEPAEPSTRPERQAADAATIDPLLAAEEASSTSAGGQQEIEQAAAVPVRAAADTSSADRSVRIDGVPHVRQKPDFCGEACAEMFLRKLGKHYDQDYVFDRSGLDPREGRGCYTRELTAALANIGFRVGSVWTKIDTARADAEMEAQWKALHADLVKGIASIVCTRYDARPNTTEHFRLVLGYDADTDEVLYHEPAVDNGAYRRMKRAEFLALWPLKYNQRQWTVVRLRLEPGTIESRRVESGFTNADYAQHIRQLRQKLNLDGFTVLIEKPFVVIGDESPQQVRRRAEGTVRWAVEKLKQDYFKKDPSQLITVWLFKDKASYEKHVDKLWGEQPSTPYGYYSSQHAALVMNISTGGGTLVHEIVHPFIESNFPDCPSWFNEGLASLYEQSGERDGRIIGHTNWRLAGLQRSIAQDAVPKFEWLCGTTTGEFYRDGRGTNYAQARYLCYYLQEQGKLRKFYHEFHKNQPRDPGGYQTLAAVLGERDMADFQSRWQRWVAGLKFP